MEPRVLERSSDRRQAAVISKIMESVVEHDPRAHLICLTIVVTLASIVMFSGLGNFPLFNPDECFYAEPAREMLDTHDYLTTTLNYAVRYTKPPLAMWVVSVCYQIFGQNEFAARFFSACCGTALVGITFSMVARFVKLRAAGLASVVLITGPLFVVTGRMAIADMPLALFIAGSLFCFFRAFREKRRSLVWLAYFLIACAVMTKGPVGVALPVLVLAAWHTLRGNLWQAFKFYKPLSGALFVALLAMPWFVAETIVTKGEYFNCFIIMENFQRFTRVVSGHKGHWYYHLLAIGAGLLPWSFFIPQALYAALLEVRRTSANARESGQNASDEKVNDSTDPFEDNSAPQLWRDDAWLLKLVPAPIADFFDSYSNLPAARDFALFSACAAIVIVAFFSASTSKLLSYTLPAFPFLAAVIGLEVDRLLTAGQSGFGAYRRRLLIPFTLLGVTYGVATAVAPTVLSMIHRAPAFLGDIVVPYCSIQFASLLVALSLFKLKRFGKAIGVFCASTLLTFAVFGFRSLSAVSNQWEGPVPEFARYAALSGEPIFVYKVRLPSVPFYTHKPTVLSPALELPIPGTNRFTGVAGENIPPTVPLLGLKAPDAPAGPELTTEDKIKSFARAYVIARRDDDAFFKRTPGFKTVAEKGLYVLVHWVKPKPISK